MSVPTPHLEAKLGDIASTVLMPGDPLRAQVVAETYLTDVMKYNNIRGMYGFTGLYKGARVSVQGSGMGVPSMGIYSYELFHFYGVERIIRIGTAGALCGDLNLGDLVIAQGASTNSNYGIMFELPGTFAPLAHYTLIEQAVEAARSMELPFRVGGVLTSDTFYGESSEFVRKWQSMGVLAVEMETAALYMNAAAAGKQALSLLTVSDNLVTGRSATSQERQSAYTDMMRVALEMT